jgi:hypothetical protein
MFDINRDSVIIKGKQPMVDWINSHDPENPVVLSSAREECTVLLIPECRNHTEATGQIEANYAVIFENELEGWYNKESM